MSDQELYIKYIKARRAGNKEVIDTLLAAGFRPDRRRLMELAQNDEKVRETLFNKTIKIKIDVGHFAGHVYGDFPIYDAEQDSIVESSFGYYPISERFPKMISGPGIVKDEVHESGRVAEKIPTHEVNLPLTEEAWVNLAHWVSKKRTDKSYYVLVGKNCSDFVDSALKEAGYEDGLLDKFDPVKVQGLDFRLIKFDMTHYFRYDQREIYLPQAQVPIMDSRSEDVQSGITVHFSKKAEEDRRQSNRQSHWNHINAFFDKHHDSNFYQTALKDKTLTLEDMVWLVRNRAPGMEKRLHLTFLHIYANASQELQQKFSHSPALFIEHLVQTMGRDPKSLDPNIQKLLITVKVEYHPYEIAVFYRQSNKIQFFSLPKNASPQQSQYARVMMGFGEEIPASMLTNALSDLKPIEVRAGLKESAESQQCFRGNILNRDITESRELSQAGSPPESGERHPSTERMDRLSESPSVTPLAFSASNLPAFSTESVKDKWIDLEKRVEAFKLKVALTQQKIQKPQPPLRRMAYSHKEKERGASMVYHCPPPYAKLPFFKAISWEKPKPVVREYDVIVHLNYKR